MWSDTQKERIKALVDEVIFELDTPLCRARLEFDEGSIEIALSLGMLHVLRVVSKAEVVLARFDLIKHTIGVMYAEIMGARNNFVDLFPEMAGKLSDAYASAAR